MHCTKCIINNHNTEMEKHGNFYNVCPRCHDVVAICPMCKTEMILKFTKPVYEHHCSPDFQIFWCPTCKNIEVIEK